MIYWMAGKCAGLPRPQLVSSGQESWHLLSGYSWADAGRQEWGRIQLLEAQLLAMAHVWRARWPCWKAAEANSPSTGEQRLMGRGSERDRDCTCQPRDCNWQWSLDPNLGPMVAEGLTIHSWCMVGEEWL